MAEKLKFASLDQTTKPHHGHPPGLEDRISFISILNSVTNAIILTDQEGMISFVNQQTEELFGYEQDELIGLKVETLLPERLHHQHTDQRNDYYTNQKIRQMGVGLNLIACRKDDTEFPCEVSLSPLKTPKGDYVVCGLHDISIRNHAEDALSESERISNMRHTELEVIYRTAPIGMCLMDVDLRFLRCNEKLAEINGISAASHIGRTLREIVPEIAETMEAVYRRVIDTGEPAIDIEASVIVGTDSQTKRYFTACYYPVKSEDGVVDGISSIVQDITERVEAEKILQDAHDQLEKRVLERTKELEKTILKSELAHNTLIENERRLRQLVESTNTIPWEANAESFQFTYVGPQAVSLLGYPLKRWYEKDFWADHIHPLDRDNAIKYCLDSSQNLDAYEFDFRMIKANGDVIWLHDIVSVDRTSGDFAVLRGFMFDVTERKKMQEEMYTAEAEARMQRGHVAHLVRVQTLGEMAVGIAHEINQPLAAINTYAQASQMHLQSRKPNIDKVRELFGKISDQAERAGNIVSHLRAMMQKKTTNPVSLDINKLLRDIAVIVEIDAKEHGCQLIYKLSGSLPHVICDGIQIEQVVLNLIRNAVDSMADMTDDDEKNIIVETGQKNDDYVLISITDCGPGVNSCDEDSIFDAFYTTKDSGLGMGLSICSTIIEDHGGMLGYSREEPGGATFHFSLPIAK